MSKISWYSLFFSFVLFGNLSAQEEGFRQWNSALGQHSQEGKLVNFVRKTGKVTLQRTNGQNLEVDFHKLSAADQKHVNRFQAKRSRDALRDKKLRDKKSNHQLDLRSPKNSETQELRQNKRRGRIKKKVADAVRLYGIDWVPELESALAVAQGRENTSADDRPVMWFRVLGQLDGYM